ncbi:S8 family serine peptidase [Leptolyngbya sp. GB1-A1]|uniref:S8 family serine peptidase n=1 Tax=Leptolyngbya sp. GB1-A1 TaxID=2933908 RepID=UPI003296F4FA
MEFLNTPSSEPEFTGRQLVLLKQDKLDEGVQLIQELASLSSTVSSTDPEQDSHSVSEADITVLETLGVAIINKPIDATHFLSLSAASEEPESPILSVEPEQYFYALMDIGDRVIAKPQPSQSGEISLQYLQGYRDGIANLVDQLANQDSLPFKSILSQTWTDTAAATWGLQATNVVNSRYSGKGIKIAVLDTGFDLNHPGFQGRTIVSRSFVQSNKSLLPVQDLNGHGTHCVGTACGPRNPKTGMRYGVAYGAEIYVAKVLDDRPVIPKGLPGEILQGIEWAILQGCHVISMSLGSPRKPGDVRPFYHKVMDRTLKAGSLVIAAAGNSRQRPAGMPAVNTPADAPAAMAVAALDAREQVADFSSQGDSVNGGQVDLIGPGVDVYSSYVLRTKAGSTTTGYSRLNGTSMAAPHVAGIAALYAEANPGTKGQALWSLLVQNARRLPLASQDAGIGLVQAP